MRTYAVMLFLLSLILCSCSADEENKNSVPAAEQNNIAASTKEKAQADRNSASKTSAENAVPAKIAPNPLLAKKADQILAFGNDAQNTLDKGFYSLADALGSNARHYAETWRLPPRPKTASRKAGRQSLIPPDGIFDQPEAAALESALLGMDKALDRILEHYNDLEKYLADDSIRDNGKRGLELAASLKQEHAGFMAARASWLAIVDKKAAEAEAYLLQDHPLNRQIRAAGRIFSQMREIGDFLATDEPAASALRDLGQNVQKIAEEAGRPPFPAAPALEKDYRTFLKAVNNYCAILDRAIAEGLHAPQKREIANAAQLCRTAYNQFARAVNQYTGRPRN